MSWVVIMVKTMIRKRINNFVGGHYGKDNEKKYDKKLHVWPLP